MADHSKKNKSTNKSPPLKEKRTKYVFYAKMVKGFVAKVLIDVLSAPLARGRLIITSSGITIREIDPDNTVLFDVSIPRGNLQDYRLTEPIKLSVNLKHTQKILKNVKKKDSVTLFIKKGSDKLGVIILPEGSKKSQRFETDYVVFKQEPEYVMDSLPDISYNYPVVVEASDFQKTKRLLSNGKTLTIKVVGDKYIIFKSDSCGLLGSTLGYGDKEWVTEEDQVYKEDFKSLTIGYLIKVPGFCGQMQFSSPKETAHPIKITVEMSQSNVVIGKMEIYIKHVRQIDYEQTLKENGPQEEPEIIEEPEDEDRPKKSVKGKKNDIEKNIKQKKERSHPSSKRKSTPKLKPGK